MNQSPLILIIDDDLLLQKAAVRLMAQAGYRTCQASDGVSGLQLARDLIPDVVLLDVNLPDMSGFDVCQAIKADPVLKYCHVILLSGSLIDWQSQVHGIEGGADGYITRPVSNEELSARVRTIIRSQQAERALRESEERYRMLIENSPDAIAVHREGRLVYANPAAARLLGAASAEELQGKSLFDIIHPENHADARQRIQKLTSGQLAAAQNVERKIIRLDGVVLDVEMQAAPVLFDGAAAIQSTIRDVTERKWAAVEHQAAVDMRRAYDYARSLIEASLDPLVTISPEGKITDVNLATEEATGVSRGDLIGTDFAEYFSEPEKARAGYLQVFEKGFVVDYPLTLRHTTGKEMDVLYNARIYRSEEGQVLGVFAAARDITERKRAEQAVREARDMLEQRVQERTAELQAANQELEKAARMKDEFLASMSHELRTPLTGILGLADVLLLPSYGELTEKQVKAVRHIHESGMHLLEVINEILDLAKLEAGKMEIQRAAFLLKNACQGSLQMNATQAGAKQLRFSLSITPEDMLLVADERRIRQIIINLLSNAIKFTPPGGRFGLEVTGDAEQQVARISVWDTGIGISPEDQQRLFQSFVQLDARLSRQYAGTGLGLALVKKLSQLHGGGVEVQSEVGKGSCFTVTLPWQE